MNPVLRHAEAAFRCRLTRFADSRSAPQLVEMRYDCLPGNPAVAVGRATLSTGDQISFRVPLDECEGWPWPELAEFEDLYERLAGRRTTVRTQLPPPAWRQFSQGVDMGAVGSDRTVQTFRGIPIRVVDDIVATDCSFLRGHINHARPQPPFEISAGAAEAIAESMAMQNELSERLSLDLFATYLYGSQAIDLPAIERRKAANARAEQLLRSWLSPEQTAELDQHNYFHVVGGATGKHYRIRRGRSMNVIELDPAGNPAVGRCFVPSGLLAEGDIMLGQKIALETKESKALAKANIFPVVDNESFGRSPLLSGW